MRLTSARLAWRNLWRHAQRTILMIAIVAFGSLVILTVWGITDGFMRTMTDAQVRYDLGDLQLRAVGYADDRVPTNGLDEAEASAVANLLAVTPDVVATPRLEAGGMLSSAYGSDGVLIRGIDPAMEPEVTSLQEGLAEGRYLAARGEVMLSKRMAERLDIRLGERVVLLTQGTERTESRAFTTVGLFAVDLSTLDAAAIISIEDAKEMTGWSGATTFVLRATNGDSVEKLQSALQNRLDSADLDGVSVDDYFTIFPMGRMMLQGTTFRTLPVVLLISLMAGFGVANTILFSVIERTREFGVMMAVGMSKRTTAQTILMESIFVAIIGFLIGGSLGYWALTYLSTHGMDFSELMAEFDAALSMPGVMYASRSGWYWLAAFATVLVTSLVAAWYPARRANRLQPVTAIREG